MSTDASRRTERTTERTPLRRDTVVRAAVALADAEGLEAVSMRRLAETLGVVAMALYKHVSDKDDLLDGMVDAILQDLPDPAAGAADPRPWRVTLPETLLATRELHARHPWARRVMETRTIRTPTVLAHMERVTQILLGAGFTADLTHHTMHLLGTRIWGFNPELFDEDKASPASRRRRTSSRPDPADYPGILAVATDARQRRPDVTGCDEDFEFRFGLEIILDGVARLHAGGWASPSRVVEARVIEAQVIEAQVAEA